MFFCFFLLLYLTGPSVLIVIDLRRLGSDVDDDFGEVDVVVDVGVDVELVVVDLLDVVVEVEVEVSGLADVLVIGTGLSADDIKD